MVGDVVLAVEVEPDEEAVELDAAEVGHWRGVSGERSEPGRGELENERLVSTNCAVIIGDFVPFCVNGFK